jgi:hypothetical protein
MPPLAMPDLVIMMDYFLISPPLFLIPYQSPFALRAG